MNKKARDKDEDAKTRGDPSSWVLGPNLRDKGSLHSDIWEGYASDLAQRNLIGVFPVGGWWKEKKLNRTTRYSLVVSIETPDIDVDIYTPVQNQVTVPVVV